LRDCPGRLDKLLWSINPACRSANLDCDTARFSLLRGVLANMALQLTRQSRFRSGPLASLGSPVDANRMDVLLG
jgi:hypothetical protein